MFIGWDVGGWNCERNNTSRDALVVIDDMGEILGKPWRGNLRQTFVEAEAAPTLISKWLHMCEVVSSPLNSSPVVLAIDAPLAMPKALLRLLGGEPSLADFSRSSQNPYLYRYTERRLADDGIVPLSVVKDMIGSQSAKAIHVLRQYFPVTLGLGIWSSGAGYTAIETYPSLCRRRDIARFHNVPETLAKQKTDVIDAWVCAEIARMFSNQRMLLEGPDEQAPDDEGWIWAPVRSDT